MDLTERAKGLALSSGADLVGVTDAAPTPQARDRLERHRREGRSGPIGFTYDRPAQAADPTLTVPWARTALVMAHDYLGQSAGPGATGGIVARFATSDHYQPLREAGRRVSELLRSEGWRAEVMVDDSRLADRVMAMRSGVGWQGRNTMVLSPGHGPWTLIGSVLTDAPLIPTRPMERGCGTCTACLPACPTAALDGDGLDARRCIAAWLQSSGSIPLWIRSHVGRRVYGCDDCSTACPPGHPSLARVEVKSAGLDFSQLLDLDDRALRSRYAHWFVPGHDGRYLRRNLLVAAGNSGERVAARSIAGHLAHRSALIRGHAAWALARASGSSAAETLSESAASETVAQARHEMELALVQATDGERHGRILAMDEWARGEPGITRLAVRLDDRAVEEFFVAGEASTPPPVTARPLAPGTAGLTMVGEPARRRA